MHGDACAIYRPGREFMPYYYAVTILPYMNTVTDYRCNVGVCHLWNCVVVMVVPSHAGTS